MAARMVEVYTAARKDAANRASTGLVHRMSHELDRAFHPEDIASK
jgi:hypothetical protein